MAYEEGLVTITLLSGAAIPQYSAVYLSAADTVSVQPLAGTSRAVGICQDEITAAGQAVTVAIGGVSKAIAGAAVTAGAVVAGSTTDGRLADISTATATKYAVGQALSTQATAAKYFNLLVKPALLLDLIV